MNRIAGPDYAKMMAIALVVFGHTLRGLVSAEIIPEDNQFWVNVDRAIYLFHMPLFFFISGMFIQGLLERDSLKNFMKRNTVVLLIPLVIWSYLQMGIQYVASANVNTQISFQDLISAPFPPRQQFWFLWSLFLISGFSALLLSIKNGKYILGFLAIATVIFLGVGHILGLGNIEFKHSGVPYLGYSLFFFPYFVIGIFLNSECSDHKLRGFICCLIIFITTIILYLLSYKESNLSYYFLSIISLYSFYKIVSMTGDFFQEKSCRTSWIHSIIIFIGMNSMIIYLAHIIAEAGVRVILLKFGVVDMTSHLIAGFTVGLFMPLLIVPISLYFQRYIPFLTKSVLPVKPFKKVNSA